MSQFTARYSDQVAKQIRDGKEPEEVQIDTRLSVMKEIGVKWLPLSWNYMCSRSDVIVKWFG